MGVVWGLIAALGYGSGDFIARGVSIRLGVYRALLYAHLGSGVLLLVVVLADGIPGSATVSAVGLAALLGALNTLATLLLYRALTIGKISVVSPITSTFGGVSLVLALLAGDPISSASVVSLVLMLVGVVIVSIVRDDPQNAAATPALRGLPEAVLTALVLGVIFWALQFVVEPLGAYLPTLIGRGMTVMLLPLLARPLRQPVALPPRNIWLNIGAVALITTIGEVAYNVGVQGTTPGIVAVLSSLFSSVTVLLALVFLRERLARHQWIGVGIIFASTLLIAYFQNFG